MERKYFVHVSDNVGTGNLGNCDWCLKISFWRAVETKVLAILSVCLNIYGGGADSNSKKVDGVANPGTLHS